jgi:LPS-assembly protein
MLPALRPLAHADSRGLPGLHAGAVTLATLALAWSFPAAAQTVDETANAPLTVQPVTDEAAASPAEQADKGERQVAFEADNFEYDYDNDVMTASGNVILRSEGQSVRADKVTWDRKTDEIVASGSIRFVDQDGNVLYADTLKLTDNFKLGAMTNMLLALREGSRLAANSGERDANGNVVLTRAAYSACAVQNESGCPKTPSWRIVAKRVIYDPEARRVRFKGAHLELFGARLLPLPGLVVSTSGRAISGLTIPNLRFSASNGLEVSEGYYWRLAGNQDLTANVYAYTQAPPMFSVQYRALTSLGAFQLTAYATHSARIPIGPQPGTQQKDWRGYFFGNGKFQFSPEWSLTVSARIASDRTFLRRYDISRDDRLRSMFDLQRIDDNSYLSIQGWATQTLRFDDPQGQVPIALPLIDYRRKFDDPVLGGSIELQLNTLAITRTAGQDTQRAFVGGRWDLSRITPWGQRITLTALLRGDVYHSDQNGLTATEVYRGNPGWETRGVAIGAFDVQWPLVGSFLGGTQVITPRFQIVATPPIKNLAIPDEDSRAIDLVDTNLFALNRFPGYDRIEDGVRFTYGFDWQFNWPNWSIKTTIGQSYRLTSEPTLLPDGTGLSDRASDLIGRTEVRYKDFIKLTHSFRLDKDTFALRVDELDATIGSVKTYAEFGYLLLNRNITSTIEDLQNSEELRFAGRAAIGTKWSIFGAAVVNLSSQSQDPTIASNGFQPLRTRLGIAYSDDCIDLNLTWRRDYVSSGDAVKGNTFQIHIALKNLGF